ncbi:NAD-dependent epimerase/dehydratase family protein, partial [Candidatus Omnitrophota bacterium]
MQFKTCLVTGGCGFIGTNIIRSLSGQIPKMRVIDDLSTGRYENIDGLGAEFIKGDI